jgi:predicted nucleic acid-binding protein
LRHALSAYDATHLALALSDQLPLATVDRALAEAALREAVPLLGPLSAS